MKNENLNNKKNEKIRGGEFMLKNSKMMKEQKGFTLIELVIIITILAVLAVIGFQTIGRSIIGKAQAQADITNAAALGDAMERAIQDETLIADTTVPVDGHRIRSGTTATISSDETIDATSTNVAAVLLGLATDKGANKLYMNKIPKPSRTTTADFSFNYDMTIGKLKIYNGATQLYPKMNSYSADSNYKILEN